MMSIFSVGIQNTYEDLKHVKVMGSEQSWKLNANTASPPTT